jgi:hypothetical protein
MASERDRDKWLERMLTQPPSSGQGGDRTYQTKGSDPLSGSCLDVDTLAAWADGALNKQEIAAAELHASSCARCQSLFAAVVRTAPPLAAARAAWTPARVVRWLAPVAAAATAVVIWVMVPDRPGTELQRAAREEAAPAAIVITPPPDAESKAQSAPAQAARSGMGYRPAEEFLQKSVDEARGQTGAQGQAGLDARADAAARRAITGVEPPPASRPAVSPSGIRDGRAEGLSELETFQSGTKNEAVPPIESVSPKDPLVRWRVSGGLSIERSTDGGKSWTTTSSPLLVATIPGSAAAKPAAPSATITAIRALDSAAATVTISDGRTFSTADAGVTWTLLQEKPAAPF